MVDEDDEPILVHRATGGDSDAFTELFHRHYSMIHAFAYRLCLESSDADEVAQETFIKAARAIATLRGSFRGWLYRIARNCAADLTRGRMRRARLADAVTVQERVRCEERPADHHGVVNALGSLPHDLREAIVLTFYESLTHAEAAKIAGCAEATLSWRVFIAKRKLREALARHTS
jgi:RNA polymerase sigma-70 factor (ECF subfamily)